MILVPFPKPLIPASPALRLGPRLLGPLPGSTLRMAFRPLGRDAQRATFFPSPAELQARFSDPGAQYAHG